MPNRLTSFFWWVLIINPNYMGFIGTLQKVGSGRLSNKKAPKSGAGGALPEPGDGPPRSKSHFGQGRYCEYRSLTSYPYSYYAFGRLVITIP